jgi:hypothetical protein
MDGAPLGRYSGAGEGVWPTVAATGNVDLGPRSFHTLSTFVLALLAELPQLLLRVLQPVPYFSSLSSRTARNRSSMES